MGQVACPVVHQLPPTFEQVRRRIGCLDLVLDPMRQCRLHNLSWMIGFLVNLIEEITASMWVGYEIGRAHAMEKSRAKILYNEVCHLPSVVGALRPLRNRKELDQCVMENVL